MQALQNWWGGFAESHPELAKWVREGGLFVIVSNAVTVLKYLLLQFLPAAFAGLGSASFGWPGIPLTLFGETFQWNILGYDSAHGGLAYFCAYMVAMVLGEVINFRSIVSSVSYGLEPLLGAYYPTWLTFGNALILFFILRWMYRQKMFVKI